MQIVKDIEQGTQEWLNARSGYVSASNGGILLTPLGKKATGQKVESYLNKLAAEKIMGKSTESGFMSDAMARGIELEDQARGWYEMATGLDAEEVTLVHQDKISCSPDALIFNQEQIKKGLEIKCPLAHTHIGYLKSGKIPNQYIPQVQVSMLVCEVDEWDFLSYHPDLQPLLLTIKRDNEWIDKFNEVLEPFITELDETVLKLSEPQTKLVIK